MREKPLFQIKLFDDDIDIIWIRPARGRTPEAQCSTCYGQGSLGAAILRRLGLEQGQSVGPGDDAYPTLLLLSAIFEAYEPFS